MEQKWSAKKTKYTRDRPTTVNIRLALRNVFLCCIGWASATTTGVPGNLKTLWLLLMAAAFFVSHRLKSPFGSASASSMAWAWCFGLWVVGWRFWLLDETPWRCFPGFFFGLSLVGFLSINEFQCGVSWVFSILSQILPCCPGGYFHRLGQHLPALTNQGLQMLETMMVESSAKVWGGNLSKSWFTFCGVVLCRYHWNQLGRWRRRYRKVWPEVILELWMAALWSRVFALWHVSKWSLC